MKIAILTIAGFPEGLAASNRVFYHAKGLLENGIYTEVIIIKPTELCSDTKNFESKGVYKNIPFFYTTNKTVRSRYFILRRIDDFLGPIKGAIHVIRNKYNAAILSSNSFYHPLLYSVMFRLFRVKFIVERTESMFHNQKTHGIYKVRKWIFERTAYKRIDALFAISYFLQEKYKTVVSKKAQVYLIPVIVDDKEIYKPEVKRTRNLVYTGPLNQKKDGILTIIKSFTKIADEYKDINLIMTGNLEKSSDREKILELVENSPFKERMCFKGFVSREELIVLLNSALALVLAKPISEQSDSCFPTKLGEYLASSNPIVITSTGEIPLYLKDGINAYIAEPSSGESFTEKLRELLNNPDKSKKIGEAGRKIAIENFNYLKISKKIIDIIHNIKI